MQLNHDLHAPGHQRRGRFRSVPQLLRFRETSKLGASGG